MYVINKSIYLKYKLNPDVKIFTNIYVAAK